MWNRKQNNSKIELGDDFCKDVSEERKRLTPILMTLCELNYKNVHLKYDKLYVNEVECDEEKCLQLISDIQPTDVRHAPGVSYSNEELNQTISTASFSGNYDAKQVDISTKRGRTDSDEDPTPTKTHRSSNKSRTTIIGTDRSQIIFVLSKTP